MSEFGGGEGEGRGGPEGESPSPLPLSLLLLSPSLLSLSPSSCLPLRLLCTCISYATCNLTLRYCQFCHCSHSCHSSLQILHVEQEVVGDDTTVIESVLACDTERTSLLQEEQDILARLHKVSA